MFPTLALTLSIAITGAAPSSSNASDQGEEGRTPESISAELGHEQRLPAVKLLQVTSAGLGERELKGIQARLAQEMALIGGELSQDAASPIATLEVRVTRIGPLVDIELTLCDSQANIANHSQKQVAVGSIAMTTLLDAPMARAVRSLAKARLLTEAADERLNGKAVDDGGALDSNLDADSAGSWLAWGVAGGGGVVAVAGFSTAALGFAAAGLEAQVLTDPNALGEDKARARMTGPAALALGALGGAAAVGGLALASTAFVME